LASRMAGFSAYDEGLNEDEKLGRRLWYFTTGGSYRFYSYLQPQRTGVLADYYQVFGSHNRGKNRFKRWGVITDPSCMTSEEVEAKFGKDVWPDPEMKGYGFDVCPGDLGKNGLLAAIGDPSKQKDNHWVNDPSCKIAGDCDLEWGTSTGAMGFRKFPNPRFNPKTWKAIGKKAKSQGVYTGEAGWKSGYSKEGGMLSDHSIEPPFLIGHTCGTCHIHFNPENPPRNPEAPQWANIKGNVGAHYLRISEILASGMERNTIEWQVFAHSRPGTSDTSAFTHDSVSNPGTQNAILNFHRRPGLVNTKDGKGLPFAATDEESQLKRKKHEYKYYGLNGEPGWKSHNGNVPHILKGGEDSVGPAGAVQRVYMNIFSCSEQCLYNNVTDLKALVGRNSQDAPMRIDQCYRDCPSFRAISKKVPEVAQFLVSQRAFDLHRAMGLDSREELKKKLGEEKVDLGMRVFAANCARCHSSRVDPKTPKKQLVNMLTKKNSKFYMLREDEEGRLVDWFGNDEKTEVTEVGTYRCRSLHRNHMTGSLFEQWGSKTLRNDYPTPNGVPELEGNTSTDGRGYYRNISLLSLWAFAPFLHNNGMGPEVCSDFFPTGPWEKKPGGCLDPNPSVENRLKHFDASLKAMFLHPEAPKFNKITRTDQSMDLPFGPRMNIGGKERGLKLSIPANVSVNLVGSLDHKALFKDLVNSVDSPTSAIKGLASFAKTNSGGGPAYEKALRSAKFSKYLNCGKPPSVGSENLEDLYEDQGHAFMEYKKDVDTNESDKFLNDEEFEGLAAFLKLL
jgi:hypothetical protein